MINLVQKNYETPNCTKQKVAFRALNLNGCNKKTLYSAFIKEIVGDTKVTEAKRHQAKVKTNNTLTLFKGVLKRFAKSETHDLSLNLKPEGAKEDLPKHILTAIFDSKNGKKTERNFLLNDGDKLTDLLHELREILPPPGVGKK